jgi:hypothetical protein
MDKTKIQEPQLGTKIQDSTIGTKIRDTPTRIKNKEDPTSTKISTIGSRTENEEDPIGIKISMIRSKTKIELLIKNLCSTKIHALAKIAKSMNTRQILNLKYPIVNSPSIKSIVDGKLLDESRIRLLASIGTFCLFIETISNEKKMERESIN